MDIYCTHIQNEEAEEYASYPANGTVGTKMHLCAACVEGLKDKFQKHLAGIVNYRLGEEMADAVEGK